MADKIVFVTVGTTQFDDLIKRVTDSSTIKILEESGFKKLLIQLGNGNYVPPKKKDGVIEIEYYRLKPSLVEDISKSQLIISHGGAGSCLETLELGKPLIIVVNENLMDNHQSELANALQTRNHAVACTVETLMDTLRNLKIDTFTPYPTPDTKLFNAYLNNLMGIKHE